MPIRHGGLLQIPLDRRGRRRARDESTLRRVNTRSSLPVSIETKAPLDLDGRKVESNGRRKFPWILDFVEVDRDS